MRGGEKTKHKVCASAGMFVTRAWTHKSWLPLAVLWDSAASQILIKTGGKGELFQLEQLPCCIIRLLSCSGGALPQQCFHKMPYKFFVDLKKKLCLQNVAEIFIYKRDSLGLAKVTFPFIFVFCCQLSSCIS